ncbi:TonB-dependent receptor [Marinomonas sp. IMCC 4694]|uniref:TonB-dependent receptor n=1 Tax=Marinomonas sp. IMCC 4694 TaxID=2605432 RepID=UPI0011E71157|nr:TonB-dependent receptor [Marinomonas sp. IMCC 4694]TYL47771.1 TonB-dependent receptor [Marinomonas sp. IMCC 4694]
MKLYTSTQLEVRPMRHHPMMLTAIAIAVSTSLSSQVLAETVGLSTLVIEETQLASDANPYSEQGAPYKAKKMSDSKYTRDIAETPKTITVLTKETLEESGKTDLESILSAQPGITLGTGEGGNSFGDRYIIRGYEARSDVYTDGLREPGLISRETFALEQVEISKGPSSTFGGRGTTGGAVNSVTKKASYNDDFTTLGGTVGTDNKQRITVDTNKVINDSLAFRLNALSSTSDTDRVNNALDQEGFLISGVYEPNADITFSADYYYFRASDKEDVGHVLDRTTQAFKAYEYVGQEGLDFKNSEADIATIKVDAYLSEDLRIENKTRFGDVVNEYIVSAYDSRFTNGLRSFTGWQESRYVGNQTNVIFDTQLFGKSHSIVSGVEYANEETRLGSYTVASTNTFTLDPYHAENNLWEGTIDRKSTSGATVKTLSLYLMDTVTVSDSLELHGGIRYDHFDYEASIAPTTSRREPVAAKQYDFSDGFFNGHFGAVFSPWEHGNLYATWSTSSNINGGEVDSLSNCGYGGVCVDSNGNYTNAEPEQSTNLELGTKWNLLNHKLLLTAALFQVTKDKVIEGGNDSYTSGGSLNTGKNRVEGVEFGLSGNLTDKLSAQAGLALMKSNTLASYDQDNVGQPKANFADQSVNVQVKYQLTPRFAMGAIATYSGEMLGGQPDEAADSDTKIRTPSYSVYDVFATYQVSDHFDLQANVQNIADKDYYTAIYRGGSIAYLGAGRSASVTAKYKF